MKQRPYRSARRIFRIMANGSSHRGVECDRTFGLEYQGSKEIPHEKCSAFFELRSCQGQGHQQPPSVVEGPIPHRALQDRGELDGHDSIHVYSSHARAAVREGGCAPPRTRGFAAMVAPLDAKPRGLPNVTIHAMWRLAPLVPALWLLAFAPGCCRKTLVAQFAPSGTSPRAGHVILRGTHSGREVTLAVVLGGPTESQDLYSFAFDLLLGNPRVVRYVPGSAKLGSALVPSAGQTTQVQASQSGDRIVVGVTKVGGGEGNGVASGEATVATLRLEVLTEGTSTIAFEGSPDNPFDPVSEPTALDSTGAVVNTVVFDQAAATLSGSEERDCPWDL